MSEFDENNLTRAEAELLFPRSTTTCNDTLSRGTFRLLNSHSGTKDAWYRYTLTADGRLVVTTYVGPANSKWEQIAIWTGEAWKRVPMAPLEDEYGNPIH